MSRLVNVLRRVARAALYAAWRGAPPDAARFCAAQYNKILARLRELEPSVEQLFAPLAEDASPAVTRLAARELAAYFEDEEARAEVFEERGAGERGAWAWPRHAGRCGGRGRRVWVWAATPAGGRRC
ncbi:MAG TPA: hypothetical protein VGV38_06300 [Pyrinomonadaceae bacterium]|nr:hypothetical protein [Pyrinomonadaceae bacterium]